MRVNISELRHNNLVLLYIYGFGESAEYKECRIMGVNYSEERVLLDESSYWHPIENIKPIMLTEEVLEKRLRAKKQVLDGGTVGFYDSYSINGYELSRVFVNMWSIMHIDCDPIYYLHQMQNVIYYLSKKELNVK
jgi:hypothetical protein